jgi:hypothetical protein
MATDQSRKRRRLITEDTLAPASHAKEAFEVQEDGVFDEVEDVEIPSDTMAALELLRNQFPVSAQVPQYSPLKCAHLHIIQTGFFRGL